MRRFIPFILLILPIMVFALPALQPVKTIAIKKHMGTWHEIALIPNENQDGCTNTTVTYSLRSNGDIGMATQCTKMVRLIRVPATRGHNSLENIALGIHGMCGHLQATTGFYTSTVNTNMPYPAHQVAIIYGF